MCSATRRVDFIYADETDLENPAIAVVVRRRGRRMDPRRADRPGKLDSAEKPHRAPQAAAFALNIVAVSTIPGYGHHRDAYCAAAH